MREGPSAETWAPYAASEARMRGASLAIRCVLGLASLEAVLTLVAISLVAGFGNLSDRGWDLLEHAVDVLAGLELVALLTAGVLFIRWQSQVLRNVRTLGGEVLSYDVRVAAVSWFIPVLNLFVPFVSLRQAAAVGRGPGDGDTRALVGLWWGLWILESALSAVLLPLTFWVDEPRSWIAVTALETASTATLLTTGFVVLWMLRALTRQHGEAARHRLAEGLEPGEVDLEAAGNRPRGAFLGWCRRRSKANGRTHDRGHEKPG